jgi:DNA repair protein RadC
MQDLPKEMMPREEFERTGASGVSTETLIAILLRSGLPGQNVSALARTVLQHFGGLEKLAKADYDELRTANIKGLGRVKCLELAAALELGRRAGHTTAKQEVDTLREPHAIYQVMAPLTHNLEQEKFWVIMLDVKTRMIGRPVEVSHGMLDSTPVHPREVFKKAIRCSAASVILAHNHPSGDPTPSKQDLEITRRLVEAAKIIGIAVLDHIIVGRPSALSIGYLSLRERELVSFSAAGK